SLQAAGPARGAARLRALSAALGLELVVRFARELAREHVGGPRRTAAASERLERPFALCRKPFPRRPAPAGPGRGVAVLVHRPRHQARDRPLVAPRIARPLRSHARARAGWKDCRRGMAGRRPAIGASCLKALAMILPGTRVNLCVWHLRAIA